MWGRASRRARISSDGFDIARFGKALCGSAASSAAPSTSIRVRLKIPFRRPLSALRRRAADAWVRALIRARQPRTRMEPAPASDRPPTSFVPASADAPAEDADAFDGARAFALLRAQCELGPRSPGSVGHARAKEALLAELARWTDETAVQAWRQKVPRGAGAGQAYEMANLFGRIDPDGAPAREGAAPELMICAHWDTRPVADSDPDPARRHLPVPGANDGASGVAVLLELARALHARRPPRSVGFCLFDGEDLGDYYYGSRIFARAAGMPGFARWRPRAAVLLDMVGGRNLRCTAEINSIVHAPSLWNRVHASAAALGLDARFHGPAMRITDDHVFLNRAGIPSIVLIDYAYPHWHTLADTVESCDAESLQTVGDVVLHFVRALPPA
ncbi:MAG: peptidase [Gemmatimonadetes bacterium]|nr:peptidase [Gemmatimonadota bacterium]